MLNVNKFSKAYSGKSRPLFIEGPVFKMEVPIQVIGGSNEESGGLNEGITEGLNEGLKLLFELIMKTPGINGNRISELLNRPIKTIERQIKVLMEKELLERRGSKRNGGYFIKTGVDFDDFEDGFRIKNGGINEGINGGLNSGLESLYEILKNNPGINANRISELLSGRPIKTVEKQLKTLVEKEMIERRGSKKTGGYFTKGELLNDNV